MNEIEGKELEAAKAQCEQCTRELKEELKPLFVQYKACNLRFKDDFAPDELMYNWEVDFENDVPAKEKRSFHFVAFYDIQDKEFKLLETSETYKGDFKGFEKRFIELLKEKLEKDSGM